MKLFLKTVLALGIFLNCLTGCQAPESESGTAFVGHWQDREKSGNKLEIVKNDAHFIVRQTTTYCFDHCTRNYPAVMKDGTLEIRNGLSLFLTIDKQTGFLIYDGRDYQRVR
ncbi:hypothetical protein RGU72_21210 [Undibacterium sp. 5I1]|uniref:hypothetical protein n=1 Tax=unclassified Undibacterium TaxID=2630295 RepID=UPI002AB4AC2C|nr:MULTISPECIES: hypothetical protein [unclassified Undibacterium]MDY7540765.1 hypothetical protein [Undibacterium sp. 5I1]MEB0233150.1 hypothetical protein [Undibacterium sp. 10I3]MEB0259431.1 hypothetical protein [Undibacterium sp. 5I1]